MKYCVKNDLSIFEFHDSEFSFISFDGTDLVVSASMVNVHKKTPQNLSDHDMEIFSAQITFKHFHAATYEPGRVWKTGEDGKSYPVEPRVVYRGQEGLARILKELRHSLTVFHFEKNNNGGGYSIGGLGIEPYFEIEFDFDEVVVSWEEYKQKAWYELHRQYQFDAALRTSNGDTAMKLTVVCHEEPVYIKGTLVQPPSVQVGCTLEGTEYWGHGSDCLWIDAFADLQRHLPEGVLLKCCLTCRHGNLCPVGNQPNAVFCTKDILITQKSDLYFCTEDDIERNKRSRQYCDLCVDYQPQADAFYTYNDYLYFLENG